MTANMNSRGEIVLPTKAAQKLGFKPGDLLVVIHEPSGRVVLQKQIPRRRGRTYLNPPPLPGAVRARLYAKPETAHDPLEAEAVALGHRALAGRKLEDL